MEKSIRIGTRGSKLALWQAHFTQKQLADIEVETSLHIIKTKGDQVQHLGFDKMEGKGFFTKDREEALLRGEIDMAVHSMKDLPTNAPPGLVITAVSYREDPSDCLLIRREETDTDAVLSLKKEAVVGTSSARRKAQMLHFRPDLQMKDIRGNVPTRLQKLAEGQFDAILLATAGLNRLELDLSDFTVMPLNPKEFIPAPAQGVLAFQTREEDIPTRKILKKIHHSDVAACTNIERKVLNLLDGGCQMPLGVYCTADDQNNYHIWAAKATAWNAPVVNVQLSSSTSFGLAEKVVENLKLKM